MLVPYEPEHLLAIQWQAGQGDFGTDRSHAEAVAGGWCAHTLLQDGEPVVCAGIVEVWKGRALAWAAFDWRIRRGSFLTAHRETLRQLDAAPYRRLEMYVKPGFGAAWLWAEMLGFDFESTMKAGAPDGRDLFVFARLNGASVYRELTGARNAVLRHSIGSSERGGRNRLRRRRKEYAGIQRGEQPAQCDNRATERNA